MTYMKKHRKESDFDKGKLVVVEGIDGSGKSTQVRLLEKWFRSKNIPVFLTEWNSSETVKQITSKGKRKGRLTPITFSLLHATDFADRYERNILPLLQSGYVVLADRYIYTAFARDIVRGCNPKWVRKVYEFAVKPDIVFYFSVPVDIARRTNTVWQAQVEILRGRYGFKSKQRSIRELQDLPKSDY